MSPSYEESVDRDFTAHEMTVLAESLDPVRENALYLTNFDIEAEQDQDFSDWAERYAESAAEAALDFLERYDLTSRASG